MDPYFGREAQHTIEAEGRLKAIRIEKEICQSRIAIVTAQCDYARPMAILLMGITSNNGDRRQELSSSGQVRSLNAGSDQNMVAKASEASLDVDGGNRGLPLAPRWFLPNVNPTHRALPPEPEPASRTASTFFCFSWTSL